MTMLKLIPKLMLMFLHSLMLKLVLLLMRMFKLVLMLKLLLKLVPILKLMIMNLRVFVLDWLTYKAIHDTQRQINVRIFFKSIF